MTKYEATTGNSVVAGGPGLKPVEHHPSGLSDGADYEVCARIAVAIVCEKEISKRQLEEDHGAVDVRFLYDYVRLILRDFLCEVWHEHRENPPAKWLVDLFDERQVSLDR